MYIAVRKDFINPQALYGLFFELLGIGTPLIIAIICGVVSDSEEEAGHFQNMLRLTKRKAITFSSQISMMIVSYGFAILLAISLYTFALAYLVRVAEINIAHYYLTGMVFIICGVFQYFLYLMIGYKYGIGMCSIAGFAGLIIAALSQTSVVDKVWIFLPWSWPNRFSTHLFSQSILVDKYTSVLKGSVTAFIITLSVIVISILWFKNWDGRKASY